MGQGESKYLSEEKKLLGEFTIDSRNKEESLTYLTSRHTHRQYLLREIVYTAEPEYQAMLKRLQQRAAVTFPHLTNLERTSLPMQAWRTSRRRTSAPITTASTRCGSSPRRHWQRRSNTAPSSSNPSSHNSCEPSSFSWQKRWAVCRNHTNASLPRRCCWHPTAPSV
jgi:hypothetical protein